MAALLFVFSCFCSLSTFRLESLPIRLLAFSLFSFLIGLRVVTPSSIIGSYCLSWEHTLFAFISEQHHLFLWLGVIWVGFVFFSFSNLFRYLDTLRLGFVVIALFGLLLLVLVLSG
ncbi:hypothetical protein BDW42DRAFT_64164 [Aspergillus taichungensis]|uniref:Uncharacterized protein n=1 Tax=Aspergillus taichungensis TaxID=482145 RepID=A0A2J5I1L1_9EURO|nr:hypothetical protein BDW42DRAFT_64164 [Aspergillus taichungensis]